MNYEKFTFGNYCMYMRKEVFDSLEENKTNVLVYLSRLSDFVADMRYNQVIKCRVAVTDIFDKFLSLE